jgi:hypothetical protein
MTETKDLKYWMRKRAYAREQAAKIRSENPEAIDLLIDAVVQLNNDEPGAEFTAEWHKAIEQIEAMPDETLAKFGLYTRYVLLSSDADNQINALQELENYASNQPPTMLM